MKTQELKQLRNQVLTIATEVGNFIKTERTNFNNSNLEEKSAHNLVTEVDKAAEALLFEKLSTLYPEAGFLGEEGNSKKGTSDYQWIVDPIDGTSNFVHNLPLYSTSIALAKGNDVVLGVVNDIAHNTNYHAVKGDGAFANNVAIRVSTSQKVYDSLFVTGFPYEEKQLDEFLDIYKYLIRNSRGVRRLGSAAIDLCYVAHGKFEAFYEIGLQPWDVAAGSLIVSEAGGHVSSINGTNNFLFGKTLLATNSHIHTEFSEILHTFLKSETHE